MFGPGAAVGGEVVGGDGGLDRTGEVERVESPGTGEVQGGDPAAREIDQRGERRGGDLRSDDGVGVGRSSAESSMARVLVPPVDLAKTAPRMVVSTPAIADVGRAAGHTAGVGGRGDAGRAWLARRSCRRRRPS